MRRKPRNLAISFIDRAQTHFGGLYFFQEFIALLQLRHRLAVSVKDERSRTRYSVPQMILALLYPVVLGLTRLEAASFLRTNGIFQYLTGLPKFPNPSTLRRFLYRAPDHLRRQLSRLSDRLTVALLQQPRRRSRLILDLDSTSLLAYGQQEGARYVHNPRRRGVRSYEPLVCCEANSGLLWTAFLRPGGRAGADEVVPFLAHAFAMLPDSVREVRLRADAGFYSDDTMTWLETNKAQYAIVARLTAPLQNRITGLRYHSVSAHWAVAETQYQATGWSQKRRIIAVRRRLADRDPQPTLFVVGRYAFSAYVTNLDLSPERVWHFYNDRAALELVIKELKQNYGLGHIPTRRFNANSFYFEVLRLAFNLVVGFRTTCLPERWHRVTLGTIRSQLLHLPAVLAKPQGRPVLRFPSCSPARQDCLFILNSLKSIRRASLWEAF